MTDTNLRYLLALEFIEGSEPDEHTAKACDVMRDVIAAGYDLEFADVTQSIVNETVMRAKACAAPHASSWQDLKDLATPIVYDPTWCTPDVRALAQLTWQDVKHGPILADALQDAGCDADRHLAALRETPSRCNALVLQSLGI